MTERTRHKGPEMRLGTYVHLQDGDVYFEDHQQWSTLTDSMVDHVIPNYHKRIASGQIVNNPCSYHHSAREAGGGSYSAQPVDPEGVVFTSSGDGSVTLAMADIVSHNVTSQLPITYLQERRDAAKSQALANVDRTPYGFLEDLFEMRETLRFLKKPHKAIADLSKNMRRDVKRHRFFKGHTAKAIADVWNAYRFAVTPLVLSSMDAVELLDSNIYSLPRRRTARGYHKSDKVNDDALIDVSPFVFTRKDHINYDIRAAIHYEVDNPVNSMPAYAGMRVKDIPETLWAVVPYSFMVDRVVNISQFVGGMTNLLDPNVKILAGSVTDRILQESTGTCIDQINPNYTISLFGDDVKDTEFTYTRETWDPSISDALPPSDVGNLVRDATYITDLIALSVSRMKFK